MGAKIASFLATLFLSVPLAAIGLMAVFGIPQLVPAVAGPENRSIVRNVQDAFSWRNSSEKNSQQTVSTNLDDAPGYGAPPSDANAWPASRPADRFPREQSPAALQDRSPQREQVASVALRQPDTSHAQPPRHWSEIPPMTESTGRGASTPPVQTAALERSRMPVANSAMSAPLAPSQQLPTDAALLTWRQASLRLHDLGIRNYHLERGASESSFLFVCVFSPGDAPQVIHRFEAEAEDPLIAVNRVLNQVDGWMRSRFAASNFPVRPQNVSLTSGTTLR